MKNIIKLSIVASIALILSGCGNVWVHNYKGESDFHSDKNSCKREARIEQPAYSGSTTNCSGYGYRVNCTTTPTPNYAPRIDWNYYNSCMMGEGWREEEKQEEESSSWFW
jgi:hypothetical protein